MTTFSLFSFICRVRRMICRFVRRTRYAQKSICTKRRGSSGNAAARNHHTWSIRMWFCIRRKIGWHRRRSAPAPIATCSSKRWSLTRWPAVRHVSTRRPTTTSRRSTSKTWCTNWVRCTITTTSCPIRNTPITMAPTPTTYRRGHFWRRNSTPTAMWCCRMCSSSGMPPIAMCHVSAAVPARWMSTMAIPLLIRRDCTNYANRFRSYRCAGKTRGHTNSSSSLAATASAAARAVQQQQTHTHRIHSILSSLYLESWNHLFIQFASRTHRSLSMTVDVCAICAVLRCVCVCAVCLFAPLVLLLANAKFCIYLPNLSISSTETVIFYDFFNCQFGQTFYFRLLNTGAGASSQ